MKKVFIFDIDGTLIDSNDLHAKAWQEALAVFDKKISFKKVRQQMGKGADQLLPEFLTVREQRQFGKALTEVRDTIFRLKYLPRVKPFPKVRELFKRIRKRGGRIALASSASEADLQKYKKIARIEDLVERSTSSDDAQATKPEPDIFQAILKKLHNPAKESVLVIGDSPYDAQAAKKAKLTVVGVLSGGFTGRALRGSGCRTVFPDVAALLKCLDEMLAM